jgi:hypothetical protein
MPTVQAAVIAPVWLTPIATPSIQGTMRQLPAGSPHDIFHIPKPAFV